MYGFVNSGLEKLIKRRFGIEKWDEIRTLSNVLLGETDSFQVNHLYKDEDTYAIVAAASEILGLDPGTILEMFGEQFLLWCQESGYAKTLQLLGRSLQDFLTSLDALHDHLSIIYPHMKSLSFRCTEGLRRSEFLLHYYSERVGLEPIVMGIVKAISREFYQTEVEMKLIVNKGQDGNDHSIFSIREVAYHTKSNSESDSSAHAVGSFSDRQLISSETFCRAFPFHIIFDSEMNILQVGTSFAWVIPNFKQSGSKLTHAFALERPRMRLTFDNILSHINIIFILKMISNPLETATAATHSDPLRLRGQMIYLPESESVLFLCSPRVKRLHDLEQKGLYLSDIPIHDATRGLLMMGQAAESEFSNSVRLEELIMELRAVQKSLEEEKKRMADLLKEMLPMSVADRLMAGQAVEAVRYEGVSVLFSDIVGFTSICSTSEPMQIVNMLNKLYSMFDQVVGQNKVYKVETIGDAYMVVGGLPEKNERHAECVVNQALDMMHYCKQVERPDNGEPIMMRIGINSGEVVAGIVGRRMPRYCLFGNTVNIASRTESSGLPGMIQITEFTHVYLKDNPGFVFEYRGPMEFKNVPKPVLCYFVLENQSKEEYTPIIIPEEPSQGFEFIVSHQASSPYLPFSPSFSPADFSPTDFIRHLTDSSDNEVTPDSSPLQRKKTTRRGHFNFPTECPFHQVVSSPTPPPRSDSESDRSSPTPEIAPSIFEFQKRRNNLREASPVHVPVMSPLEEAQCEDWADTTANKSLQIAPNHTEAETTNQKAPEAEVTNQKAPEAEVTNQKAPEAETTDERLSHEKREQTRKISDISDQSVECSSKVSDASNNAAETGSGDLRKLSTASNPDSKMSDSSSMEEELDYIQKNRRGSVTKKVEFFDSLSRQRRTGLSTTAYTINLGPNMEKQGSLPTVKGIIINSRPKRKSLDSLGSSGSNEDNL